MTGRPATTPSASSPISPRRRRAFTAHRRTQCDFHEVGAWDSIADIVGAAWLIAPARRGTLDDRRAAARRRQGFHRPWPAAGAGAGHGPADRRLPDDRRRHCRRARDADRRGDRSPSLRPGPHPRGARAGSSARRTVSAPGPFPASATACAFSPSRPTIRQRLATDRIVVLECEIDDQTGEDLALAIDRLRALDGVLDIIQAPVFGKKGRMMTHLRVLADEAAEDAVVAAIFDETTTLGLRRSPVERYHPRARDGLDRGRRSRAPRQASRSPERDGRRRWRPTISPTSPAQGRASSLRRQGEAPFEDEEKS